MAARNSEKGIAAMEDVTKQSPRMSVSFLELDLASFNSIKESARTFLASNSQLDLLFLNAGILGCPPGFSKEGKDGRVIGLSSRGYNYVGSHPFSRYVQSKLANLLYAQQLGKGCPQFITVSVDPGSGKAELFSRQPGDGQVVHLQTVLAPQKSISVEEGVTNQLWAASAEGVTSGLSYELVGVSEVAKGFAHDEEMAKNLWDWTERELESHDIQPEGLGEFVSEDLSSRLGKILRRV
ncbi:Fc.00g104220.m01.CDS01 [Cosmosporella sp. VM-42]